MTVAEYVLRGVEGNQYDPDKFHAGDFVASCLSSNGLTAGNEGILEAVSAVAPIPKAF